ncbi:calpain family cysteine protease domain-containing protein [Cyclospora cayetanensis]|nr:calpain family cysteine protease domain-containing protein [Cyclospora cayetanensis]
MKVFAHIPAVLKPLPPLFGPEWTSVYMSGAWTAENAGGCSNDLWSFFTNPHFRLTAPQPCEAVIFLECPQEYSVNLRLFSGRIATPRLLRTGKAQTSGSYRAGCCLLSSFLAAGDYTLICSTFKPQNLGAFQISLHYRIASTSTSGEAGDGGHPTLAPLPYPYAIPPDPRLFLHTIRGPSVAAKASRHAWGRVALQLLSAPTKVSLRLQVIARKLPLKTPPVLSLYLFAPSDSCSSNGDGSSKEGKHLQLVKKSDLEGGLSEDGRVKSSAAQDLLQRQGVLNITLAELNDTNHAYIVFISTPPKSSSACSSAEVDGEWEPTPWVLHIISDQDVQCSAL